ncbi:pentapeptide repeat-containing protein [Nocardia sp. NPDC059246]|uniref:pentapeptide repeat-containing protein n=1 Tax=unclassified Nocardia TaxID=2637762 RepID=UPI0036C75041
MRLFTAVTWALAVGVGIAVTSQLVLKWVIKTNQNQAAPIDVTKLALTVVGGVGGAVALVVAYRRQRDLEQNRFVERFGAAAAQLGSADVAVRIAGVYAMAGVADESAGANRQQCIEVLCGYLRLQYDAAHGGSGRTKLVTRTVVERDDVSRNVEVEEHTKYRQNDREVRQTIVRVIVERLRTGTAQDWSRNNFDFRGAHLESADFNGARFAGIGRFEGTHFSGNAWFHDATFSSSANFRKATISSTADFGEATFSSTADFREVTFSSTADFGQTTFSSTANFGEATFPSVANFRKATFSGSARFWRATFSSTADFGQTTFSGVTHFMKATFSGDADFKKVTFSGAVGFSGTDFGSGIVSFENPRRWDPAPVFDWDSDSTKKPANVEPQRWPPQWAA